MVDHMAQENQIGTLYVVAVPIGDTNDITERARCVLSGVDFIAAEDTRSAGLLLKALNIKNKLVSNQKFNEKQREGYIIGELERGMDVAIISDAGTPCISDPGGVIVRAAAERGVRVVAVCGASAVTAALSICGFPFDSFAFLGFFPRAAKEIGRALGTPDMTGGGCGAALVFFESPKRVKRTMEIIAAEAPGASICLCNDLTKQYERVYRGTARDILAELTANPSAEKGEYTLVLYNEKRDEAPSAPDSSLAFDSDLSTAGNFTSDAGLSPEAAIADYLVKNGGTPKDAVATLAKNRRYKKKDLYEAAIVLKRIFGK